MAKAFEDDNGNRSVMRMVWAGAVIIFMGTWAVVSAQNGQLEHLTMGDAMFFASLLGLKVGQKAIEVWKENGKNNK